MPARKQDASQVLLIKLSADSYLLRIHRRQQRRDHADQIVRFDRLRQVPVEPGVERAPPVHVARVGGDGDRDQRRAVPLARACLTSW